MGCKGVQEANARLKSFEDCMQVYDSKIHKEHEGKYRQSYINVQAQLLELTFIYMYVCLSLPKSSTPKLSSFVAPTSFFSFRK